MSDSSENSPDFSGSTVGQTKMVCDPSNPPECYVSFRPKKNWYGEYGFDWLREGDFPITAADGGVLSKLNLKFEDIVGYHTKLNPTTGVNEVFNPDAEYGLMSLTTPFTPDAVLYSYLRNDYMPSDIYINNSPVTTYTSFLSIFRKEDDAASPKKDADIIAKVYINPAQPPPDEIILDYNTSLLSITPALTVSGTLDAPSEQSINVKCLTTFENDQLVVVKSKKTDDCGIPQFQVIGNLQVMANARSKRKIQRVMIVSVTTPDIVSAAPDPALNLVGQLNSGELDLFTKFLHQALIDPVLDGDAIPLDLSGETDFKTKYTSNGYVILSGGTNNVIPYLKQKTKDYLTRRNDSRLAHVDDASYKIAYYFGAKIGGIYQNPTRVEAYGGLRLPNTNVFVMGPNKFENCLPHEFLHALELPHTFTPSPFSADALYTYRFGNTDNVMDYSYSVQGAGYSKCGFSLYKWQWAIAQSNCQDEPAPPPNAPGTPGSTPGPDGFHLEILGYKIF